jgi:hypothetical protein
MQSHDEVTAGTSVARPGRGSLGDGCGTEEPGGMDVTLAHETTLTDGNAR